MFHRRSQQQQDQQQDQQHARSRQQLNRINEEADEADREAEALLITLLSTAAMKMGMWTSTQQPLMKGSCMAVMMGTQGIIQLCTLILILICCQSRKQISIRQLKPVTMMTRWSAMNTHTAKGWVVQVQQVQVVMAVMSAVMVQ